jgi:prepilin-type N-terminal cleavage/methylation domain-containing protein
MSKGIIKKLQSQGGLTLVEIMITILILSVGILSSLLYFTTISASNELARNLTTATTHAEYILEEMRLRPSLSNITGTDWHTWASGQSILSLGSETINVTYTNATAVPLAVSTVVSWQGRTGAKNVTILTEFTK